jgi:uncharacterized cupredoxin-like copper-binding protein
MVTRPPRPSALVGVLALGLAAVALAYGTGGVAATTVRPASATAAAGTTVRTAAAAHQRLAFTTRTLTAKRGRITIVMTNPRSAGLRHGIAVAGHGVDKDGSIVAAGRTASVTVRLKPGRYTFYCPVPGHRAGGMKGTLIVR